MSDLQRQEVAAAIVAAATQIEAVLGPDEVAVVFVFNTQGGSAQFSRVALETVLRHVVAWSCRQLADLRDTLKRFDRRIDA